MTRYEVEVVMEPDIYVEPGLHFNLLVHGLQAGSRTMLSTMSYFHFMLSVFAKPGNWSNFESVTTMSHRYVYEAWELEQPRVM